jgi:Phytanoyl-CoA dioxygenase (PhyH)
MIHRANGDFWNNYHALPANIRARADKQFALLASGPLNTPMIPAQKITELHRKGFCILKAHLPPPLIEACREAFWPTLLDYLETHAEKPNRGPHRHFVPMPFEPPCFTPEFFFDAGVLSVVRGTMAESVVADQWGCDVPVRGSQNQEAHVDYQRPLFTEAPDLLLPPYMLVVSFGLIPITPAHGPIEIAPGTHSMGREEAMRAVKSGEIELQSVPLNIGDILIRHPWALHRGTPNMTDTPRALVTVRYVRSWYSDNSREVNPIPRALWQSLTPEQQRLMRFPIGN